VKNAPSLWPGLTSTYAAFCELSTCRSLGFSPGPIPWTVIMQYAEMDGLHGHERANLLYLIRAMDRAYLKHSSSDKKPAGKPEGGRIGGK
jgi:hypothetical protein